MTYKREDYFNVIDNGDTKEIANIVEKAQQDKLSLNPMILLATWKDDLDTMTSLLQLGADPVTRDHEWRTCLHLAANNDSTLAVKLLLEHKVRATCFKLVIKEIYLRIYIRWLNYGFAIKLT